MLMRLSCNATPFHLRGCVAVLPMGKWRVGLICSNPSPVQRRSSCCGRSWHLLEGHHNSGRTHGCLCVGVIGMSLDSKVSIGSPVYTIFYIMKNSLPLTSLLFNSKD